MYTLVYQIIKSTKVGVPPLPNALAPSAQANYEVLGTWRQVHCNYIRFVQKKYYNLLFQLFSAIILLI